MAPSSRLELPAGHGVHAADPSVDAYDPIMHLLHVRLLVARESPLAVPLGHLTHVAAPASLHVPAVQSWHDDMVSAPTLVEFVPAGHLIHSVAASLLYVPAAQAVQTK